MKTPLPTHAPDCCLYSAAREIARRERDAPGFHFPTALEQAATASAADLADLLRGRFTAARPSLIRERARVLVQSCY